MTEEKTCYNCGNKNCNIYYSTVKKDYKRHFEIYEYNDFDCKNHDKWEELKVEEIRTDNTETLKNALERIKELERENADKQIIKKQVADLPMFATEILLKKRKSQRIGDCIITQTESSRQSNIHQLILIIGMFLTEIGKAK